jgi:hypothetical protein
MLEQQVRAELEAEAWRRLRLDLAVVQPAPAAAPQAPPQAQVQPAIVDDPHTSGSTILKAIARFALGSFGAYLAYLAAVDWGLGEFEAWFATGSAFFVTLALSMFGPARRFVHFLAETMRWALILAVGMGGLWMMLHMQA